MHIIDKVFELPIGPLETFVADNLSYALAAGSQAGILDKDSWPIIDSLFSTSNVTYFIANSAKALAKAISMDLNQTTLEQLEKYATAPQVIYSTEFVAGSHIMSALGIPLTVTVQDGDTYINSAKITSSDNFVSNGVLHVIDE